MCDTLIWPLSLFQYWASNIMNSHKCVRTDLSLSTERWSCECGTCGKSMSTSTGRAAVLMEPVLVGLCPGGWPCHCLGAWLALRWWWGIEGAGILRVIVHGFVQTHCTMRYALKKPWISRICQIEPLRSHLPNSELFQMKIFENNICVSFTFFQIFGTSWKHTTKLIIFAASISQVPSSDLGTSWPQALKQSFKYLERAKKNANIFRF